MHCPAKIRITLRQPPHSVQQGELAPAKDDQSKTARVHSQAMAAQDEKSRVNLDRELLAKLAVDHKTKREFRWSNGQVEVVDTKRDGHDECTRSASRCTQGHQ